MPMIMSHDQRDTNVFAKIFWDNAKTIFQLAIFVSVLLYAYLFYGLFTGQLVNVPHMPIAEQQRVLGNIQNVSLALNCSLAVVILTGIVMYYNEAALGFVFLVISALLAFGLQYAIQTLFGADAVRYVQGQASEMTLHEIWFTGMFFGVPGILLVFWNIGRNIVLGRSGSDLIEHEFGQGVARQKVERSLIPAFAKCWQLPFCREGIRKSCPIYHAKTKCWRERVGCMCESHIIHLAVTNAAVDREKAAPGPSSGFVPIGTLLMEPSQRTEVMTKTGPRGVHIPQNPHLSDSQKRERCRNCIIYNEHQRHKYQLLAPIVTVLIPLYTYLHFDDLRQALADYMHGMDQTTSRLAFGMGHGGVSDLTRNVTGSVSIETIIIVCLALMLTTMLLRFAEFCIFKIKI